MKYINDEVEHPSKETHMGARSLGEKKGSLPVTEPCRGVKPGFPIPSPLVAFPESPKSSLAEEVVKEGKSWGEARTEV